MPVSWSAIGTLAAVALGAWAVRRVWWGYPPAPPDAKVLSRREIAFLAAAADATYPSGGPVPPSGSEAGVPSYADRYVAAVPPGTGLLMRLLFFLVEHATLAFPAPGRGGRRRFSSLSPDQRGAVLEAWGTSSWFPRRLVFSSLRAILTMGYFADPVVLRALDLAPRAIETPVVEADLLYPPIGAPRDAIRHRPGDLSPIGGAPVGPGAPLHPAYREPAS
ncbi:MAG: hypothetical protein CL910_14865 [Deltaproteobacteria bacterium]|jgi:hypothetical protein|nr:hypothetical protein [Deltaproteobacteria bacterium]